ncbi:cytochrome P450 [Phycomyces nitens]|nr:cytochrome P450 [Phycomyces nitens]
MNTLSVLSPNLSFYDTLFYAGVYSPLAGIVFLVLRYHYRRKTSVLASAPLIPTKNFWISNFGLVPPPNEAETTDELSNFLISVGQDSKQSPLSVSWSIFGSPLVIVNSLKGIKDVLISGQIRSKVQGRPSNVQRGNLIRLIQNHVFGGENINNATGEGWRWRRHVLLPPFQPRQLVPNLLPYVVKRAHKLLDMFGKAADQGTALELDGVFQDLTMDVINFYLYGRSDLNYSLVGGKENLKVIAWLPFGLNKTKWAQRGFGPSRKLLKEFVEDSITLAVEKQKEYEDNGQVFQSVTAAALSSGKYHPDQFDLINDLLSLTFAGYDTTAHTLAFCFSELARDPALQEELFLQVRAVLGPPPVLPESITAERLAKMPLVSAVYRETLRKYPAVAFIPAHVNYNTVVDGVVVPAESEIWCNLRGIQMNPEIFPNPDKFDPSRWIRPGDTSDSLGGFDSMAADHNREGPAVTPDKQYNFPDLSFTLGPHSCLGKNMVILELRTTIACTINEFTFSLKKDSVIDTKIVLTTKPRYGVWTHFQRRSE